MTGTGAHQSALGLALSASQASAATGRGTHPALTGHARFAQG